MRPKLQAKRVRGRNALRMETMPPVFGRIKQGRGLRHCLLPGWSGDKVRRPSNDAGAPAAVPGPPGAVARAAQYPRQCPTPAAILRQAARKGVTPSVHSSHSFTMSRAQLPSELA